MMSRFDIDCANCTLYTSSNHYVNSRESELASFKLSRNYLKLFRR